MFAADSYSFTARGAENLGKTHPQNLNRNSETDPNFSTCDQTEAPHTQKKFLLKVQEIRPCGAFIYSENVFVPDIACFCAERGR